MTPDSLKKLRDIYRAIAAMESQMVSQHGVNLNEVALVCMLSGCSCGCGPTDKTASEIAEGLGLTPSNSSKVVAAMEKKGLVHRKLDKGDKRMMHFTLTPKGKQLAQQIGCCSIAIPAELQGIV